MEQMRRRFKTAIKDRIDEENQKRQKEAKKRERAKLENGMEEAREWRNSQVDK
jgi:hypothetical protein